ncbi:MAG: cation:proton antiporter [Candidatus Hadarchaeaceae archaeon]
MINILLLVGVILALGYIVGRGTHALKITGVVGYIIVGVILGSSIFGIVNVLGISEEAFSTLWGITTDFTLALIAFIIGSQLTLRLMRNLGKPILAMIFGESFGAFFLVLLGVYLITQNLPLALLLASLAPASAPAGTVAVLHEYRAKGPLTDAILAVIGWDDALAIVIFVVAISIIKAMLGGGISLFSAVAYPIVEIFGGLALGAAIGGALAFAVKKVRERESILVISFAAILIGAGVAEFLGFSLILTCMAIGIVLINILPTMGGTSRGLIENIMPPIYVIFFALAGMQLRFDLLITMGLLGLIYIVCRTAGLIGGASISAKAARAPTIFQKYLGFGILSQAGVAIGLAALAGSMLAGYPGGVDLGLKAITLIMATTIVFEIIGPIGARFAIIRAREARRK